MDNLGDNKPVYSNSQNPKLSNPSSFLPTTIPLKVSSLDTPEITHNKRPATIHPGLGSWPWINSGQTNLILHQLVLPAAAAASSATIAALIDSGSLRQIRNSLSSVGKESTGAPPSHKKKRRRRRKRKRRQATKKTQDAPSQDLQNSQTDNTQ